MATFDSLKQLMVTASVLTLPDFTKPFVLETDASKVGIRVRLMQEDKPITFFSKARDLKFQAMSTYDKELFALMFAIKKWHSLSFKKSLYYQN